MRGIKGAALLWLNFAFLAAVPEEATGQTYEIMGSSIFSDHPHIPRRALCRYRATLLRLLYAVLPAAHT